MSLFYLVVKSKELMHKKKLFMALLKRLEIKVRIKADRPLSKANHNC